MTTVIRRIGILALMALLIVGMAHPATASPGRDAEQASTNTNASSGWDMALTGGFVVSGLTDPVYALNTVSGQPTRVVVRLTEEESSVSLGVAMFALLYHERASWIAPVSFGIGIRGDSATFYMGSALRFGPHASFTGGAAIGAVNTLPPGVVEGRPVTDTNFLVTLPKRTTRSWFAGLTYTFTSLR